MPFFIFIDAGGPSRFSLCNPNPIDHVERVFSGDMSSQSGLNDCDHWFALSDEFVAERGLQDRKILRRSQLADREIDSVYITKDPADSA